MKKILLSLLTALTFGSLAISAQTINNLGEGKYSISTGDVSLTVDSSRGGKILSFKYQDKEVLSQTRMPNSFGSTFWTSPQKEWNWPPVPEFDTKPYTAEVKDNALVLTGSKSERFGYRIRKVFTADPKDNAVVITHIVSP